MFTYARPQFGITLTPWQLDHGVGLHRERRGEFTYSLSSSIRCFRYDVPAGREIDSMSDM